MFATSTISATPVPVGSVVAKLPKGEPLPAVYLSAGAVPVFIAPAAIDPTQASSFRTTGDLSPVIFCSYTSWALAPLGWSFTGDAPLAPAALAGAAEIAPTSLQTAKSFDFAVFYRTDRVEDSVGVLGKTRDHEEGYLLNTAAVGSVWPQFARANFS